jgi:histidine triad (HIT) family protein
VHSHQPPDYDCPFCRYTRGDYNEFVAVSHVVETTSQTLSFVSPKWGVNNEGHVIVIPVQHVENLYELPDSLAAPLLGAVRRAALALKAAYGCAGTSIRQHNEPAGNQDVWHLHVHVFPRHEGDGLYGAPSRQAQHGEMNDYAVRLRRAYAAL